MRETENHRCIRVVADIVPIFVGTSMVADATEGIGR